MIIDIGFLGLGRMGAAMAERLEGSQLRLHVYDPDISRTVAFRDRGGIVHTTAKAVAEEASIVFACLPSPEVSLEVAKQIAGANAMSVYIECSSIGRLAVEQIAHGLASHDTTLVDAPVSGGPEAARDGRLTMMTAGDPATIAQIRPWLEQIAGTVISVGNVAGLAQAMKLANNLLAATNLAASVEVLTFGVKVGLDSKTMLEVINSSSGRNSATSTLLQTYLSNANAVYGAAMAVMIKDIELGLKEARACGLKLPVANAVADQWRHCVETVGLQHDILGYISVQEDIADVCFRADLGSR